MWKLLSLLAGAAGVVGFFLPLALYTDQAGHLVTSTSAYEIATSAADASGVAELAKGLGASSDQAERLAHAMNQGLMAYRGAIVAFYVPAALQALFGLVNLLRSRMGRLAGLMAILFGLANLAVFAFFYVGDQRNGDPSASLGYGVWLLAAAGAGGVLAGLATLIAPDRD